MTIPRSEHPRPQLRRESWENLNGLWDFAFDLSVSGLDRAFYQNGVYTHKIVVPFCPESKLSGIEFTDFIPAVWYRRRFTVDERRMGGRTLLHFGAVDHLCRVWVNGAEAGGHRGGYTSFCLDITAYVHAGENTLVVYAADDIRGGKQASGKQSTEYASHGCFYTRVTGIWQTVWLEYVPNAYVASLRITPDALNGSVVIDAELVGGSGATVAFTALLEGKAVAGKTVRATERSARCCLDIPDAKLWSPQEPTLYDLHIELRSPQGVDLASSYFGLRSVEWHDHGFYLNGKPLFQRLILDQGYYPDGIYTAPDDAALVRDIQLAMRLGFNGARLHEKVFEERWLYHADRLGYLAWGEFGSWGLDITTADGLERFLPEWMEAMKRDHSHPCIIGWCPFNETFDVPLDAPRKAQDDDVLRRVYAVTKAMDSSRPVIDTSGFYHVQTDIYDLHDYEQYPEVFAERYGHLQPGDACYDEKGERQHYDGSQPLFMSEYGGTFWMNDAQALQNVRQDPGWSKWEKPTSQEEVCRRYVGLTTVLLKSRAFCGFCYTQLTDVEQEVNGLYTYAREPKFSTEIYERIRAANTQPAAIE